MATSAAADPAPMVRKARPQASRLVSPPARSSTAPTASGPRNAPVNPRIECTASVAPRWPGAEVATAPPVSAADARGGADEHDHHAEPARLCDVGALAGEGRRLDEKGHEP